MALKRHLRGPKNARLREALEDPDFRRAANAKVIHLAEDEGVDVNNDRPFLQWFIQNIGPLIVKALEALLASLLAGGAV